MKILRMIAVVVLFFIGIGALAGGWSLMTDPSGQGIQLSLSYLEHSHFNDYLIPGIILFTVNGVFCLIVLMAALMKWYHHEVLIMVQGALLAGWIIIQVMIIQVIYYLHYVCGLMGVYLILFGMLSYINNKSVRSEGEDQLSY